jgi:hypothetical protein
MSNSNTNNDLTKKHALLVTLILTILLTGILVGRSYAANATETYPDFKGSSDAIAQSNTIYNSPANKFFCIAKETYKTLQLQSEQ